MKRISAEMEIQENLNNLKSSLPADVTLIAVSKTKPIEDILEAYNAGQIDFGENKVQELTSKQADLPVDIKWHMIGHLQRNKVKYLAPFVHLIHSVDSERLLKEINKQALKNERIIPCLLQVHIAKEETKHGWDREELVEFLNSGRLQDMKGVTIHGLMGMATFTENMEQVKDEFANLKYLFDEIKSDFQSTLPEFETLSMGMTGDYLQAIESGSNMIRVGTAIFGARNYCKK